MDISVIKVLDRMDIAHERIVLLANEDCNLCPYTLFNNGEIDQTRYSDHLPLKFCVNIL